MATTRSALGLLGHSRVGYLILGVIAGVVAFATFLLADRLAVRPAKSALPVLSSASAVPPTTARFAQRLVAWSGAHGKEHSDRARLTGERIAFSCNGDICVMNVEGRGLQRLTRDKWINSYPAWSPDGRRIAFTGYRANNTVIFVMNSDGSNRRLLTPLGENDALPAWSPDGRTIAYDNNSSGEIELMNPDGTHRRPLMHRSASLPTWSPDATSLAFVSGNGRKLALTSGDIYVVKADGSGQRRLVRNGTFPSWSPDGKQIAFLRNKRTRSNAVEIWIMTANGTRKRRLSARSDEGGVLSWSPDGKKLAITSDSDIYAINADGSASRKLAGPGDNLDPAWQPMPRLMAQLLAPESL